MSYNKIINECFHVLTVKRYWNDINWLYIGVVKVSYNPASIYLFKVNNGNTKTMCKIYSKLTTYQNDVTNVVLVFYC